jgi:hypothetical protein
LGKMLRETLGSALESTRLVFPKGRIVDTIVDRQQRALMNNIAVRLDGNQRFWNLAVRRGLLLGVIALCGCGAARANGPNAPIENHRDLSFHHQACDISSSQVQAIDANNDGRADLTIVSEGGREVCRAADLDFDGRVDAWTYYDASGKVSRREFAFDRDGSIDEIQIFAGGQVVEKQRASTLAHRVDTWEKYSGGRLVSAERDSNGDGRVDQWWDYKTPDCPMIRSDIDGNGQPDPNSVIDYCKETNYKPQEQIDNTRPEMLKKETDALPTETSNTEVPTSGGATSKSAADSSAASKQAPAAQKPATGGKP